MSSMTSHQSETSPGPLTPSASTQKTKNTWIHTKRPQRSSSHLKLVIETEDTHKQWHVRKFYKHKIILKDVKRYSVPVHVFGFCTVFQNPLRHCATIHWTVSLLSAL